MARKMFVEMVDYLESEGHLDYGNLLSVGILESCIGIPYDPQSWEWRGKCLELKMAIEERGFFLTQRNERPGSMRIMSLDKMPEKVDRVINSIVNRQKRVIKTMKNANIEDLEYKERSEHYNAISRMAMVVRANQSPLAGVNY